MDPMTGRANLTAEERGLRARLLPTLDAAVEAGWMTRDDALVVLDRFDSPARVDAALAEVEERIKAETESWLTRPMREDQPNTVGKGLVLASVLVAEIRAEVSS